MLLVDSKVYQRSVISLANSSIAKSSYKIIQADNFTNDLMKSLSHDSNMNITNAMVETDYPENIISIHRINKGHYKFKIKWWYNINDHIKDGGRSGYEYFEEEDNYIYTIAQFFPRMCMYNDVYGLGTNFCVTLLIDTPSIDKPFHLSKKNLLPSQRTPSNPNVTL